MKDILIVEDGQQERERLERLFTEEGYSTVACDSVANAESYLLSETFRLAILDIGLNDKSGSYLFHQLKQRQGVSFVIIFTGNPSVHLKQRFLAEGAVDYIVKGSPHAQNDAFIARVREVLGSAQEEAVEGVDLESFLQQHVLPSSAQLFLDSSNSFPSCRSCGSTRYIVTFQHQTQMPPELVGMVVCAQCASPMDADIG